MTSGGRKVDVGGEGSNSNNVLDFIIKHSNDSQDPRHDGQYSTSLGRNSLCGLLHMNLLLGTAYPTSTSCPPCVHLTSTRRHSHDKCSQALPVFHALLLPCIILNANRRTKNGGGLGTTTCTCLIRRMGNVCSSLASLSLSLPHAAW